MKTRTVLATFALLSAAGLAVGSDPPRWKTAPAPELQPSPLATGDTGALNLRKSIALPAFVPEGAAPRSLASYDMTGDGVADLVCGYAVDGAGLLVVYPGNIDSFFPRKPEALDRKAEGRFVDSPFLPSTWEVLSPAAPDLLAAGDFDGDGLGDLVAAARGDASLVLLSGDGRSGFRAPRRVDLPGPITALAAGEMNRPDGSLDLAIAVAGPGKGASLLVFDAPTGSIDGRPERIPIPEPATALALGMLDADSSWDLAAAAGNRLVVVHGRDRTASRGDRPVVEVRRVGQRIVDLAAGSYPHSSASLHSLALLVADGSLRHFDSGRELRREVVGRTVSAGSLPLLTRVTEWNGDRPLVLDRGHHVQDLADSPAEPVAVLALQLNGDALTDLVIFGAESPAPFVLRTEAAQTFLVECTSDADDLNPCDGACKSTASCCTLRAAIREANCYPDLNDIVFTASVDKIGTANLPITNYPVTIDGMHPNGSRVELAATGTSTSGINVVANSCVLRSLEIKSFDCAGIRIRGAGNRVEDCWIGLDENGGDANGWGIEIDRGDSNTIGGKPSSARNVLSHNRIFGVGIIGDETDAASDNRIEGNFIGTSVTGTASSPNGGDDACTNSSAAFGGGVTIGDYMGGTTGGNVVTGNLISGNKGPGVRLTGGGDLVQNNLIGTTESGTAGMANDDSGLWVLESGYGQGHTIGGGQASLGNVISGNAFHGIHILGPCGTSVGCNKIHGNRIGTDKAGVLDLGNGQSGVLLEGTNFTEVGHASSAAGVAPGNLISGNTRNGVEMIGGGGNPVVANLVGTNTAGTAALANSLAGVRIASSSSNNVVGGTSADARNVISGNGTDGVVIDSSSVNWVQGNYIGTNANGNAALGNLGNGVFITGTSQTRFNTIGGVPQVTGAPPGNVISGNRQNGVLLCTTFVTSNRVGGNLIGTSAAGNGPIGNWINGVAIDDAQSNDIGVSGTLTGANTISGNNRYTTTDGVEVSGSQASGNVISSNDIGTPFANRGAGVRIQLGADSTRIWINRITNNLSGGVLVTASDSVDNSIQYNSIYENNGGLGIDLFPIGVTLNDAGDADTGANNLQNFPSITAYCDESGTSSTIWGTLNGSGPNKTYAIDLFNSLSSNGSGYGEGQFWLGQTTCTIVGATGTCTFSKVVSGCSLSIVTATATDPSNSTSEFSHAFWVAQ